MLQGGRSGEPGKSFLRGAMGGEAGLQNPWEPLLSASSRSLFYPPWAQSAPPILSASSSVHHQPSSWDTDSLCSFPRHPMRTPPQTTRSHTASCRHLPSVTTLTSRCWTGMEVSAGRRTAVPPMSNSSLGCAHTPASHRVSRL